MEPSRRRALGIFGAVAAGVAGLGAAVRGLGSPAPRAKVAEGTVRRTEDYGDHSRQFGEWWVPPGATGLLPTVVLVHGGYWRDQYDLSLEDAVAADLAARGFLVWNVDYRPSSDPWPATLTDVAAAYDHLGRGAYADRVDPARIATVGHSAGGHLALWLASRANLRAGAPGAANPFTAPSLVVAQAPVASLRDAARLGLGGGAVQALLGGQPDAVPERYDAADPVALLPTSCPVVCVHAPGDDLVPVSQSRDYVAVGFPSTSLVEVAGGHFEHLDPATEAVAALRTALERL